MKLYLGLILASTILTTSCKKEEKPTLQNTTTPAEVAPFNGFNDQAPVATPAATQQQQQQIISNTTSSAPAASGSNPAHGQPGHRCDIPVGTPLNSPPAAKPKMPQPVVAPPQPVMTENFVVPPPAPGTPQTIAAPTPEGMNPPHGQTNHRCDIAVGAPLPK